jgi:hypothetical protein
VGDTDAARPLLQDEEYAAILSRYPYNIGLATILESLANKVSAYPDEYDETGRIKLSWRERGKAWLANAKRLREEQVDDTIITPQRDGVAIGEIAVNTDGYRPHENGALSWTPWGG